MKAHYHVEPPQKTFPDGKTDEHESSRNLIMVELADN